MSKVYFSNVIGIGAMAPSFYADKMIILFKSDAPDELKEYCIIHEQNELNGEILVGDLFKIGESEYKVTAVGSAVNQNLGALGHITIRFNGNTEADLPGTLCLEDKEIKEITEGDILQIVR
ncbi:PTS glucitol/sorbitol transporter subunit IIA [Caldalkalibacillus mannanilyticus]|uniref:PTS glucitol/sorbitol transporter subunit IIA n=1 Tax=Caldalkalibacillus mannanilyticus TaxID=1418 RepID=UPI0004685274|nr:PTS glucitol/sorbitol transporter subunit IIA [Caldalkalibacillus mannanilyticus]